MNKDNSTIDDVRHLVEEINANASLPEGIVITRNNYQIIDLERYLAVPREFRGNYQTASLDSFVAYVKAHNRGGADSAIFIDTNCATAFFDFRRHRRHAATLTMQLGETYVAMTEQLAKPMEQIDAINWVSRLAPAVYGPDGVRAPEVVHYLRSLTKNESTQTNLVVADDKATRTTIEQVEFQKGKALSHVDFHVTPYHEGRQRAFSTRIVLTAHRDGDPRVSFVCDDLAEQVADYREEFRDKVAKALEGLEIPVYLGSFATPQLK